MNNADTEQKKFQDYVEELRQHTEKFRRGNDDDVSLGVSEHLLTRHTQLYWLVELTQEHQVHKALMKEYEKPKEKKQNGGDQPYLGYLQPSHDAAREKLHPEERAYHLAVTDLFVEKAQAFLEQRATSYRSSGKMARRLSSVIIMIGAVLAWQQMVVHGGECAPSWLGLASSFVRGFTAYGMIVLAAVGFWRYSKSMLDQAERLYERRHALRQGRLFVHLNDGRLTIDEMEKAFKWNVSQENAFAQINTEASAPWGVVAKEFAKGIPEIFKAGLQASGKGKSEEK